jgi:hypothetical protein
MSQPALEERSIDVKGDAFAVLNYQLFETWADFSVFAILDGASVPRLPELLDESGLAYTCLYSGDMVEELARTAPYLVRLQAYHPLAQRIFAQGWGQHWGVFIASNEELSQLRKHFRQFLRVLSPEGKTLYFRFYDPRVLRTYLGTCQPKELVDFFGPCEAMALEGPRGQALLNYRLTGAKAPLEPKGVAT